ncbi:MAG: MAPEG family protein [Lysobacterales bacterium]|jgi:uncharacterized membrane protein YecN with MAPEG domain
MTIPVWVLLGFAVWTLLLLTATVGVYRWSEVLRGRVALHGLRYDAIEGHPDWYRRGMRAHGNCVENLPVYTAIVVALYLVGLDNRLLDVLAIVLFVARVCQGVVHAAFPETDVTVSVRFSFYAVQVVAMFWMAMIAVNSAI